MRKTSHLVNFLVALGILMTMACGRITRRFQEVATPTEIDIQAAVTMLAATAEAAFTESTQEAPSMDAGPTQAAIPTDTPVPPTETVTATPEEMAPDPLPASHTGVNLDNGECFNFDTGQVAASPDAQCDVLLVDSALMRQVNGAQISGYVSMSVPTRSKCAAARFEPGDLAVQTDLYYCFISSEGKIGFIVPRTYLGGIPSTGIIFDYWVFR